MNPHRQSRLQNQLDKGPRAEPPDRDSQSLTLCLPSPKSQRRLSLTGVFRRLIQAESKRFNHRNGDLAKRIPFY